MPDPSRHDDQVARPLARARRILARKWAYVLHSSVFLPQSQAELERETTSRRT
jgi:hypothetical protein